MIDKIFGTNVFSEAVMARYLPEEVLCRLRRVQQQGETLTMDTADAVADAMRTWAMERGATHYCHWFQPLTGSTAQKQDSFLSGSRDGNAIVRLTGRQLVMGESDASSFPTGGLRQTAYARGYTGWDMTSPAFLKEEAAGIILCIPTIFVSHTGDALDTKTPLLRSMDALDAQARRIVRLFGPDSGRIVPYVGVEQEYFLVDREQYLKRPDLWYCGRTLFGAPAPKGQELDDQYFGVIRHRQGAFMAALNRQLWRMGVPAATQHNEVAPAQHELACIYCRANVSVDQNQLVMETMKRLAGQYGLVCLLHEKPFAGVNGSGKHNNWSLGTESGENLLQPGEDPGSDLRFQLILACILRAVDRHADLLRLSAGNPGNDLRLGGQEAPPPVISVYLGDQLGQMLSGEDACVPGEARLDTGVAAVPALEKDLSDRNRTTPFAFTGNKFEFRMVGASDSVASANTILNTIVAESFCDAADLLENSPDWMADCRALIRAWLRRHGRILFRGDGYSDAWAQEARRRGLPSLPGMVDAVPALLTEKAVALFEKFRVFRPSELKARAEVLYETYAKHIRIEAQTMLHMAARLYIPAAIRFARTLSEGVHALALALPGREKGPQQALLERVQALLEQICLRRDALAQQLERLGPVADAAALARACRGQVVPRMEALRQAVDDLEQLTPGDLWPVPTYGQMLFEV